MPGSRLPRSFQARGLVEAIGTGDIAAGEFSAFYAGQIRGGEDAALTAWRSTTTGTPQSTGGGKYPSFPATAISARFPESSASVGDELLIG
jgi:hypothetical protein